MGYARAVFPARPAGFDRRRLLLVGRTGVDLAGALVAPGPVEELVDGVDRVVDAGVEIAQLGEPGRHRRHGAVARLDRVESVVLRDLGQRVARLESERD